MLDSLLSLDNIAQYFGNVVSDYRDTIEWEVKGTRTLNTRPSADVGQDRGIDCESERNFWEETIFWRETWGEINGDVSTVVGG